MKMEEIFAGSGVGILTGLLIGLSVSPVVGPVLGAILAFGMLWLGYKEHQNLSLDAANAAIIARVRSAIATRLAFFCFSCAAGLLLGVFLRANDTFAPNLESKRDEWIQLGYSKDEANKILAQKELQFSSSGVPTFASATSGAPRPESTSVLYSASFPEGLALSLFDPNEYRNIKSVLARYEVLGDEWCEATEFLKEINNEDDQRQALKAIFRILQILERKEK